MLPPVAPYEPPEKIFEKDLPLRMRKLMHQLRSCGVECRANHHRELRIDRGRYELVVGGGYRRDSFHVSVYRIIGPINPADPLSMLSRFDKKTCLRVVEQISSENIPSATKTICRLAERYTEDIAYEN